MATLGQARARLRFRRPFGHRALGKHEAQLRWWLEEWDPIIRAGGLNPGDALAYLGDERVEPTYIGRRWQLARSQVRRLLVEAAIGNERFFAGKVVVDVGPGPVGFPDACPARVSIGIDPLAERYSEHGLLLPDSGAVYLPASAEQLPLLSSSADAVIARDTLDYVEDPARALAEMHRILAPGGALILLFDVGHTPSVAQPNALTLSGVRAGLRGLTVVREHAWAEPFGHDGHRVVLVAAKPAAGEGATGEG